MSEVVIGPALQRARAAGRDWAARGLAVRLDVVAKARRLIAREATALAATVARPAADTLVAEVLPLAEAARFLVRAAPRLLAPRRLRSGRPLWLFGVRAELWREPRGAVLILGPGNYPLFLPGAQALQALAAGNAVCVKPAPGTSGPMLALADLLTRAGLPDGVLQVLDEDAGPAASRAGFDYIVLTGGAETGTQVLHAAADSLTPAAMELSGVDAVFVLPGADLAVVAACLAYGLRLNGGATCIAPRRVFVPQADAAALLSQLVSRLPPPAAIPPAVAAKLTALLDAAAAAGARIVARNPAVLADARPEMTLLQQDVFAPWLALVPVASPEAALRAADACPFALGASVFGPEAAARQLARRVRAGSVCINDLIVPTADPRLPFGGRGRSGFGATRGAEGLLEMTVAKAVSTRAGQFRPHLHPATSADADRFAALTRLLHGDWHDRWAALRGLR
ncbi:MAG: aldehyde dehydrogenase family protein [Acetobacteraceae bacterium]